MPDQILRDRLVCGIPDQLFRESLLAQRKLELKDCVEQCKAAERASRQSRVIKDIGPKKSAQDATLEHGA